MCRPTRLAGPISGRFIWPGPRRPLIADLYQLSICVFWKRRRIFAPSAQIVTFDMADGGRRAASAQDSPAGVQIDRLTKAHLDRLTKARLTRQTSLPLEYTGRRRIEKQERADNCEQNNSGGGGGGARVQSSGRQAAGGSQPAASVNRRQIRPVDRLDRRRASPLSQWATERPGRPAGRRGAHKLAAA